MRNKDHRFKHVEHDATLVMVGGRVYKLSQQMGRIRSHMTLHIFWWLFSNRTLLSNCTVKSFVNYLLKNEIAHVQETSLDDGKVY